MAFTAGNLVLSVLLLAGMLALLEVGRRLGAKSGAGKDDAGSAMEAAVFGLLGLLIAFSFSGAASRFDERRRLATEEANALGTLVLRLDLVSAEERSGLRKELLAYVDARLASHRSRGDAAAEDRLWAEVGQRQATVWALTLAAARRPELAPPLGAMVISAANDAFDAATRRKAALDGHPPSVIFAMLAALSLAASLLAGLGLGQRRPRLHLLIFAFAISGTFFITRDLEHPREGFIRVDSADKPIVELRATLAEPAQ